MNVGLRSLYTLISEGMADLEYLQVDTHSSASAEFVPTNDHLPVEDHHNKPCSLSYMHLLEMRQYEHVVI